VDRVGESEDVVRRLPVGVLVGAAETRHPERRPAFLWRLEAEEK
jgi:hypothetical protein